MVSLLGKRCSWESRSTGNIDTGYIIAVRIDDYVQTSLTVNNLDDRQPWRPIERINLFPDAQMPPLKIPRRLQNAERLIMSGFAVPLTKVTDWSLSPALRLMQPKTPLQVDAEPTIQFSSQILQPNKSTSGQCELLDSAANRET